MSWGQVTRGPHLMPGELDFILRVMGSPERYFLWGVSQSDFYLKKKNTKKQKTTNPEVVQLKSGAWPWWGGREETAGGRKMS